MANINIENRVQDERGFIERVLDGAGAAVGTSYLARALISGASPYSTVAGYGIPYLGFKAVKGAYNIIRNPIKNLNIDGIGRAIYDVYRNIIPYRERVPASIGGISSGLSYAIG